MSDAPVRHDTIAVIDFGSQYSQLIARRIRELHVYSELVRYDAPWEQVQRLNPKGFILSGGPASVYEPGAPQAPDYVFQSGLPVLGICYGMQLMAHQLGGKVDASAHREYGLARLEVDETSSPLYSGLPRDVTVWMSHGDRITEPPAGFRSLAHTDSSPIAAMGDGKCMFGLQFHPEVVHTPKGRQILANFVYRVCKAEPTWTPANLVAETIENVRAQVGPEGKVVCGLSGGVDSTVVATLINRAIGPRLTCVFVDHGLLRKNEATECMATFAELGLKVIHVDASERFMERLVEVVDPEEKRHIIGEEFVRVFEEEAAHLGKVDFLAQGTLYPDVIESAGADTKTAVRIKTHHNVGGLPEIMTLRLVEPLRHLFKDEVRAVGEELGLPESTVWRHPFPGPGLAVRCIGALTPGRLATLRDADAIVLEEIRNAGLYRETSQVFAVLTPVCSVGVMGDSRTYSNVVAVRAVTSEDFMTADWARLPYDVLARISSRIVNEVPGVNRVVYDISSKPPSTIEWE